MRHRYSITVLITVIIVLTISLLAQAARVNRSDRTPPNRAEVLKNMAQAYAIPLKSINQRPGESAPRGVPVGTVTDAGTGISPGLTIGDADYELQHWGSMGRMIETGPHSGITGHRIVHMGWMGWAGVANPIYVYRAYNTENGTITTPYFFQTPPDQGEFVNIDVTPDNRAVVGGHVDEGATVPFQPQIYFDGGPAYTTFPNYIRVPDSHAAYEQITADEAMWPKFFFQFGYDTVFHVFAAMNEPPEIWNRALMYFRHVGFEGSGNWAFPPYVVDTAHGVSQDVVGQRVGDRVCLAWIAGTNSGDIDTDIYYEISENQGQSFEPRVNLTMDDPDVGDYMAYSDLSIVLDQSDNLHVVWPACQWPGDPCVDAGDECFSGNTDRLASRVRLFHWSENVDYIRTICDYGTELSDSCGPGAWALEISKPTISECDSKLYAIWTQFNDPHHGIIADCAQWGYDESEYNGAANGEIYVSVSEDWGLTWDPQRNLTNSYTPHCDPIMADECQSDNWASMSRSGQPVQPGEDWTMAVVVDPSGGSYAGDYYLDIQYINDLDAGAAILGEGSQTINHVKWFRMPCVDAVPAPIFAAEWTSLGEPCYVKPGVQLDTPLTLWNFGNVTLNYALSVIEDNGPSGWLQVSGYAGTILSGLGNTGFGTVHLNYGGLIATYGNYYGRLHFDGNDADNFPFDIEIELIIADTIMTPVWDTVNTGCLSLIVSNNGNMGKDGNHKTNMDYYDAGDCDTTADIYLYDGSPLIGRIENATDTVFNYAMWGVDYADESGFRPQGGQIPTFYCQSLGAEIFESGTFTTQDSTIAFEKIWLAPQTDCEFIIQYMRVWSYDGASHTNLVLGEAIDWDIPHDQRVGDDRDIPFNIGGIDFPRGLLYCQGYEAYGAGADTAYPYNCQYNDARFGGSAIIESYLNSSFRADMVWGGFVGENDLLQAGEGFDHGVLYQEMELPGLRTTGATEDLHTVVTYECDLDLGATDVYEVVTVQATVENGTLEDLQAAIDIARAWYIAMGGMAMFADEDGDGQIDVGETCCETMGKFYNDGTPFSIIDLDNWIHWQLRYPGVPLPPDCPTQLDIYDDTSRCVMAGNVCIYPDCQLDIMDLDRWIDILLRDPGGIPLPVQCPMGDVCASYTVSCCALMGDFNRDWEVDQTDVDMLTQWLFNPTWPECGEDPVCCDQLDIDKDDDVDMDDLFAIIEFVSEGEPELGSCPTDPADHDWCWHCQPPK